MAKEKSIFDQELENRKKDQEVKKASNELQSQSIPDRISLSLPSDCKIKFLNYCKEHYISPSAQLRAWIDQNCND